MDRKEGTEDDHEFGRWLSTLAMCTLEDNLVVCREDWNEASFMAKEDLVVTPQ